jgi:hypothetical protein
MLQYALTMVISLAIIAALTWAVSQAPYAVVFQ